MGDDRYHVNDKWIEPSDRPTLEELIAASKKAAVESVSLCGGNRPYDVVRPTRGWRIGISSKTCCA